MACVSDYTFNKTSRISNDQCDRSQQNIQNAQAATYMLDNFRPACPMKKAIDFATCQLDVNFTGSHQIGINGCNVDEYSELSMSDLSKPALDAVNNGEIKFYPERWTKTYNHWLENIIFHW